MAEPISMDDILGGEKPVSFETPKEAPPKEPLVIPKLGDTPLPEKVEVPKSSKKAWQNREQGAKGLVRDPETGQFAPKPEVELTKEPVKEPVKAEPAKPVAAPQQEFTEKEKAFLKAAQEERGKRQEWERRVAAGEYVKAGASPVAAPDATEQPKTFWDDPAAALAKQQAENRTIAQTTRLQVAEMLARQRHTDFDEKIEVFGKIIQKTPGLYQQWMEALDPAEFAYSIGKNHMEYQEVGSLEEVKAKAKKEARIELEAELKEKAKALEKERAALPPSLSEARSTGVNKPVWGGVPSMDEILKG